MTPPDSGEREYPCPHARPSWRMCPHCLGLNAPVPDMVITSDVQESLVGLPLPLAQRILAALRGTEPMESWRERDALAAELRAIVERKP